MQGERRTKGKSKNFTFYPEPTTNRATKSHVQNLSILQPFPQLYPLRSFVARPPARGDNAVSVANLIFHVGDVSIIPLAVYLAYQIPLRSVLLVLFPLRNILQMHFIGLTLSAFSPLAGGVPPQAGRG